MYVGADEISSLISRKVFRFSDERGLQDGIETFLKSKSIPYEREFVLSPQNRIDFLLGDIGLEVKVDSSPNTVQRQLWRYAEDPRIKTLILVTTRSPHKSIARTLLGKPVLVVHLLASIF
jgi:hypothetical protein